VFIFCRSEAGKRFAKIGLVCRVRLVASEEWDSFRYASKKGLSGEQIRPYYDLVYTRLPCSADTLAFTISHSAARAEVACSAAFDGSPWFRDIILHCLVACHLLTQCTESW